MPTERADGAHGTPFVRRWQDRVTLLEYRGKPVVVAREFGLMLDYAGGGQNLPDLISTKWSEDFLPEIDLIVLRGEELRNFKRLTESVGLDLVGRRAPSLLLLTESGVQLVLARSDKAEGRAFRRWLVSEVIPAYQASRGLPGAAPRAVAEDLPRRPAAGQRALTAAQRAGIEAAHDVELLRRTLTRLRQHGEVTTSAAASLTVLVDDLHDGLKKALATATTPPPPPPAPEPRRLPAPAPTPPPPPQLEGELDSDARTLDDYRAAYQAGRISREAYDVARVLSAGARVVVTHQRLSPPQLSRLADELEQLLDRMDVPTMAEA